MAEKGHETRQRETVLRSRRKGAVVSTDPIVSMVITRLLERSRAGQKKYGSDLTRSDLALRDWLEHALEEAMDFALYLQRAITELEAADE